MASGATAREVPAEIQYGLRPTEAPCAQSVLRARAMASRQPFDALDARQSEFCGEDTTAGVDMRKLRFRPRPSSQGGGYPRVLFLPLPRSRLGRLLTERNWVSAGGSSGGS